MTFTLRIFQILGLAVLSVVLGEVAWTIHRIRPKVEVTISNADRTLIIMGAAATHLEKAAGTWEQASKSQALATSQTMLNVGAAAKQLSGFISRTDSSVNSVLLPALSNSITEQSAALLVTQKELQTNLSQMGQATQQLQATLAAANAVIADPQIKETLLHVDETSANVAESTKHLERSTQDVQDVADYYKKKLTTPVSFWKTLLTNALQFGSQARILFNK
jgi:hypothetical protein